MPTRRTVENKSKTLTNTGRFPCYFAKHPFLYATLLASTITIISMFSNSYSNLDDDFGISLALSGRFPGSGLCLFVNAIISNLCLGLSQLLPNINTFWMLEVVAGGFSLLRIYFLTFKFGKNRPLMYALSAILTIVILPGFTYESNFSIVACICVLASMLGYMCDLTIGKKYIKSLPSAFWKESLINSVYFLLGFCIRQDVAFLSIPFVIYCLWINKREFNVRAKKLILMFLPLVAMIIFASFYSKLMWGSSPWCDWLEYNSYRTIINDYPMQDYHDVANKLQPLGISENDYTFAKCWLTADESVFNIECMKAISKCTSNASTSQIISSIPDSFAEYARSFITDFSTKNKLLAGIILMYLWSVIFSKYKIPAVVLFFLTYLLSVGFVSIGRFPYRVEVAVWTFSFIALSLMNCSESLFHAKKRDRTLLVSFCLFAVCFVLVLISRALDFNYQELFNTLNLDESNIQSDVVKYSEQHPNEIYVYDVTSFHDNIELAYKNRYLPSREFLMRNLNLGGWDVMSPYWLKKSEILGSNSYFKSLIDNKNWYYITSEPQIIPLIQLYLKEHYNTDTSWSSEEIEANSVWKVKFEAV